MAQVDPTQKRGPRPIVHDPELLSAIPPRPNFLDHQEGVMDGNDL